jgi:uncharacterized membrane protein
LVDPFAAVQPAQKILTVITIGGVIGSLMDSWLGATYQAIYRCPQCQKDTEKTPLHSCGSETFHVRGIKWLNNDMVNVLCTVSGSATALLFLLLVAR